MKREFLSEQHRRAVLSPSFWATGVLRGNVRPGDVPGMRRGL